MTDHKTEEPNVQPDAEPDMEPDMEPETLTLRPSALAFSRNGAVVFGVQSMRSAPPRMRLLPHVDGADLEPCWLSLGETVDFGGITWRFEDVHFANPDRWVATVRSVPPGSPPFTPPPLTGDRVWNPVPMQPAGRVDEAAIAALEQRLGLADGLPPGYRRWLGENNGATPQGPVEIPGHRFQLSQARPLLGIHPDEPHLDLGLGLTRAPAAFLRDHVVIAVATGGLLGVRVTVPGLDEIVFLNELGVTYGAPPLEIVAPDIFSFCAYLQPAPPVELGELAEPGADEWEGYLEDDDDIPAAAEASGEVDLVEAIGQALEFANRSRATMAAHFGVRSVAEVAMLARTARTERRGRCADGLRYYIHGNGYDVLTPAGVALTVQASGYARTDRAAVPEDGLTDTVDLYALQGFLAERTGTTVDVETIAAACAEHVRRGAIRPAGTISFELPPVPGGVEEQQ